MQQQHDRGPLRNRNVLSHVRSKIEKAYKDYSPSLILATPGCWACEEMGALLAGVFCGVLVVKVHCQRHRSMHAQNGKGVDIRRSSLGSTVFDGLGHCECS